MNYKNEISDIFKKLSELYKKNNRKINYLIIIFLLIGLSLYLHLPYINGDRLSAADSNGYEYLAYNIARYGIYAVDTDIDLSLLNKAQLKDYKKNNTYYKRDPGYSIYLALFLLFSPEMKTQSPSFLDEQDNPIGKKVRKKIQAVTLLLMLILILSVFFITYKFTSQLLLSFIISIIFIFSVPLDLKCILSGNMLMWHSYFLYLALKKTEKKILNIFYVFISGLLLALLIYTKAIYQYWFILIIFSGFVFFILIKDNKKRVHFLKTSILISVITFFFISPWLIRNKIKADDFSISGRKGVILAIRAEYSTMTWGEYFGSFIHYLSGQPEYLFRFRENYLKKLYSPPVYGYRRFDRNNTDDGLYRTVKWSKGKVNKLANKLLEEDESLNGNPEKAITKAAKIMLKENWFKHLMLTFTFGYRGFTIRNSYTYINMKNELLNKIKLIIELFKVFFVPFFLITSIFLFIKKKYYMLFFYLPALYCYSIHAFATHFIPRYIESILPIIFISLGITSDYFFLKFKKFFSKKSIKN
ncbi:MAG: hypothetical protein MJB14_14595 [Spirochaetes bacterium]|nr:hypothetical protein [Spirochaetota bacterium]